MQRQILVLLEIETKHPRRIGKACGFDIVMLLFTSGTAPRGGCGLVTNSGTERRAYRSLATRTSVCPLEQDMGSVSELQNGNTHVQGHRYFHQSLTFVLAFFKRTSH